MIGRLAVGALIAGAVLAGAARGATGVGDCPTYNPPNTLVLGAGTPQSARLATPFATPLQVELANTNGCPLTTPLAGIAVTFAAPASGPSGTFASSGSNAVLLGTSSSGSAAAPAFTANSLTGGYIVTASSDYGSVTFFLVNTASGVSGTITSAGTARQSATVGTRYGAPLQATVTDATGAPVGGASVTFSLAGAGGSSTASAPAGATFDGGETQATAVTDATGVARSPSFKANAVEGAFTASASTAGVTQPALYPLRNLASKPSVLARHGRGSQSAKAGARYGHPLEVVVRSAGGRPLEGVTVTFSLGSAAAGGTEAAGASFVGGSAQATAVTDAAGLAVSPLFTANSTPGKFTATASMSGVTRPVTFTLENRSVGTASIAPYRAASNRATIDTSFPHRLKARVLDGTGERVRGATVTFELGAGGGTSAGATFAGGSAQATATTNAAGVATSPTLTAGDIAGVFSATASSTAAVGAATFTLRNLPGAPDLVTAGAASGGSAPMGGRFPVHPAVKVTDAKGNAVPGAVVTFSAPATGPSGRFSGHRRTVRVNTDSSGVAVAPMLVANHKAGGYVVRASVRGAQATAFALVNLPGR